MINSTVSGNLADFEGGGINNYFGTTLTLTNSTVGNNSAKDGGGIRNLDTLILINSTVSNNTAISTGGGIRNTGAASLSVTNSSLSGNTAVVGGGIQNIGQVELVNTIVANNPSGGDCDGSITSLGHNLGSDNTCNLTDPDDLPAWIRSLAPCSTTAALLSHTPCCSAARPSTQVTTLLPRQQTSAVSRAPRVLPAISARSNWSRLRHHPRNPNAHTHADAYTYTYTRPGRIWPWPVGNGGAAYSGVPLGKAAAQVADGRVITNPRLKSGVHATPLMVSQSADSAH